MDVSALDFAPLTEPLDRAEEQRADAAAREHGLAGSEAVGGCVLIGLVLVACGLGALIFGAMAGPLAVVLSGVVALVAIVFIVRSTRRETTAGRARRYRLQRFAERNGARYLPRVTAPVKPGRIFASSGGSVSGDVVDFAGPREIEVGRHSYLAGYRSGETRTWAYAAATLEHDAPRLTVDLRKRAGAARLAAPGPLDVALGDVDLSGLEHGDELAARFVVSSRVGRGETARGLLERTLFTPELLRRFVEHPLDLEIVDRRLILTSPEMLPGVEPETWRWLLELLVDLADAIDADRRTAG